MARKRTGGTGFGGLNTETSQKAKKPQDIVDIFDLVSDYTQVRLVGDVWSYATHWIEIKTDKGVFNIPKCSLSYDPDTDTFDDTLEDPYVKIENKRTCSKRYYVNAIIRDLQDMQPRKVKHSKDERKSGIATKGGGWTPVRVISIPTSVANELGKLRALNKHKVKGKMQACDITDDALGCDVFLSLDKAAKPAKYSVNKGDASPLNDEEQKFLTWDISELQVPETLEMARKEAAALESKSGLEPDIDSDEDDDEDDYAKLEKKVKKKKTDKKSKRNRKDKDRKKSKKEDTEDDAAARRKARRLRRKKRMAKKEASK